MVTMDLCRQDMVQAFSMDMDGYTTVDMWEPMCFLWQLCCMQVQDMMPYYSGASYQMLLNMCQDVSAYYDGVEEQQMIVMEEMMDSMYQPTFISSHVVVVDETMDYISHTYYDV